MKPVPYILPYTELPCVTTRALGEHYKLYLGYRDAVQKADQALEELRAPERFSLVDPYRLVSRARSTALAAVDLHEAYFSNLAAEPGTPSKETLQALNTKYGSFAGWWREMRAATISARGWAVLGRYDCGDLDIFVLDDHDTGACFGYEAMIVLDTFEHAYFMDWGTDKVGYIDCLIKHLDWQEIERRFVK